MIRQSSEKTRLPENDALLVSAAEPYRRIFADAKREGLSWRAHCAEIEEYEFPGRGRWLRGGTDALAEHKPYSDRLINNKPLLARRIVTSGLQTGLIPSSREWFEIRPEDEELRDDGRVTWHLSKLKKKILRILSGSNFYSEVGGVFDDTVSFSTSAMLMEDDDETVLNFVRLPAGSFWPVVDAANRASGLFRRYALSSEAMARTFGPGKIPERVREQLRNGRRLERTVVIQAIMPVDPRDPEAPDWAKYESAYFAEDRPEGGDRLLARTYYRARPFVVFRWSVDDGSAYGTRCPGMDCLGDCKQLQALERKKLMAIDVAIDPPVLAPQSLLGQLNRRPGKVTWYGGESPEAVRPLLNVQFDIDRIRNEILEVGQRIEAAHYTTYFVAALSQGKQMTAEEARQRAEEKMMILGPVVERFQYDLLEPILDRTIDAIMFHGLAPDPPEELAGEVKYTYSGPLALIQQMVELGNVRQWLSLAADMAAGMGKTGALDRIDEDEVIEAAAKILAVDPALVASFEDAKKARLARGRQMRQAAQAEAMHGAADDALTMSKARSFANQAFKPPNA